jgi:tripartite-type tricarboxylate transporter receptor subunit TctC
MKARRIRLAAALAALLGAAPMPATAIAQTSDLAVADFYRGKQMRMIIRSGPGGGFDLYSRLLARFMVNHIPGNPTIINQNMPGAGGITAANYVADVAPRDGTVITMAGQALPLDQALGFTPTLTADLRTFSWIGNMSDSNILSYMWHENPVKTMDDARRIETTIGSVGAGDASSWLPEVYNKVLGTKLKTIGGYQSGSEVKLAMERGEIGGFGANPLSALLSASPDYLPQKKVSVLVQIGLRREAKLPDAPLLSELARNDQEREILGYISKALAVGRPIGVGPGVPKERVKALRKAFDATLADPAFIAQAQKEGADIGPMSGTTVQQLIEDVLGAPAELKAKVKAIMPPR